MDHEKRSDMKITAIRPFAVWVGSRNQLIVKVETDEGIFGWGESGLSGREKAVIGALEHIASSAKWCTKAREELGGEVVLGIDYHHRLSVAEAASFCQKMPRGTLDFIEEPIRDETPEAYESLRRMTDIPFAIGEEFASKWQFLPYIERGITQFVRIDICNVGGFTEAMT